MFFFEKKNQKTFVPWFTSVATRVTKETKVFCFFSSEKKCFLQDVDKGLAIFACWAYTASLLFSADSPACPDQK
jgi:hypothetical protein